MILFGMPGWFGSANHKQPMCLR